MTSLRQRKATPFDLEDGSGLGVAEEMGGIDVNVNESNISMKDLLMKYHYLQQYNLQLENKLTQLNQQLYHPSSNPSNSSTLSSPVASSPSLPYGHDDNKKYDNREQQLFTLNSYLKIITDRGSWLIGLLILQSFSSIILSKYELLLQQHPALIYFLTMLIGAGGNAGSQATVRMIRELALGRITPANRLGYIYRELMIAITLSFLVGFTGFLRAIFSSKTTSSEVMAITIALMVIVIISILLGTILPLVLDFFKVDPAHSSTSIQVIMDILGVLLVCSVASLLL
jgi:cation transporter-like permease